MRQLKLMAALLAALSFWSPVQAADSTVAAMSAASALSGSELLYCVQSAADRKCTAVQMSAYVFGSVSGDLTFNGSGVGTITKVNGVTFPSSFTSGGIPYASSASTISSSAALGANVPVFGGGAGVAPFTGTRSGNTTQVVTTTGTQTSGDCVKIDASGNHIANGSACGGGGSYSVAFPYINNGGSGQWYPPDGIVAAAAGGALGVTTTYCVPNIIRSQATIDQLGAWVTTLGTSNIQLAVYSNAVDASNQNRPATLLANTGSIVNTSTGFASGVINNPGGISSKALGSASGPTAYWFCGQANDVTVRMLSPTVTSLLPAQNIGASAGLRSISTAVVTGVSVTGTFGTWPSSLGGSTFTEITNSASMIAGFRVISVP